MKRRRDGIRNTHRSDGRDLLLSGNSITVKIAAMKVGIALNMPCQAGRPDTAVIEQHLQLSDLAEPLGFDSLLALEHHFTVYAMSPAPLQLLSYFAGRTRGIHLGTLVIVIPWHDPIRIAEQNRAARMFFPMTVPVRLRAACTARVEDEGFRIPTYEARPRFKEGLDIIRFGLMRREVSEAPGPIRLHDPLYLDQAGHSFQHLELRLYGSANSPGSGRTAGRFRPGAVARSSCTTNGRRPRTRSTTSTK